MSGNESERGRASENANEREEQSHGAKESWTEEKELSRAGAGRSGPEGVKTQLRKRKRKWKAQQRWPMTGG